MKFFRTFICLFIVVITVASCKPELPSWENENVFPLANTRIYTHSFIADTLLSQDNDGVLSLFYEYNLTDFNTDSLITGLDTIASYQYNSPFTITLPPGAQVLSLAEVERLAVSNVYLKEMHILDGYLKVRTQNIYSQPIIVEYTIPDAHINGNVLKLYREIPAAPSPSQPFVIDEKIHVAGLKWFFFSIGVNQYNCFNTTFKVWISPNATENVTVNHSDAFTFFMGFDEIEISYLRGFFGQHNFSMIESNDIDIFKNISADNFQLEDIELSLEVTNNMGADIRMRLLEMKGKNTHNDQEVSYSGPYLNSPLNIIRAAEISPGQGLISPQPFSFDFAQNSNLKAFVENLPGIIDINMQLDINPLGNTSGGNDFYYGVPIQAKLVFKMPLHFSVNNLVLSETSDISDNFLNNNVESLTLKAIVQNTFPIEFIMETQFLDSLQNTLYSLPFSTPIAAATTGSNGRTTEERQSTVFIHIPKAGIQHIREASKIKFTLTVNTLPSGTNVKIFHDYYVDIRTFAIVNYIINQGE
jgi:hypothetical protein